MTVKELIEELKCYQDNQKVWISIAGKYLQVESVEVEELINDDDVVLG
jgi:hypothetical protein